jgi:hypothetical protein
LGKGGANDIRESCVKAGPINVRARAVVIVGFNAADMVELAG